MGHSYRSDPRGLAAACADLFGAEALEPQGGERCWTPFRLALVWLFAAGAEGLTLRRRFADAGVEAERLAPRPRGVDAPTYQGFVKALRRGGEEFAAKLRAAFRAHLRRHAGPAWRCGGFVPLAVDGTRLDTPRSASCQDAFGEGSRAGSAPQLELTAVWHLGAHAWHDFRIGDGHESERTLFRRMIPELPEDGLLVADAGFVGYDLCAELERRGRKFVWRVGANVRLLSELGAHQRAGKNEVWLWPQDRRDEPPLRLRLIRVGRGKNQCWLVTNVLDPRELPKRAASALYRRRWGIECAYRALKQTFGRAKLRSRAADLARLELAGVMLGHWLLALLSLRARGPTRAARDWSPARSAEALRGILTDGSSSRAWRAALRAALAAPPKPGRPRKRTRQEWVRKKITRPPGAPRIRPATPAELQAATALAATAAA